MHSVMIAAIDLVYAKAQNYRIPDIRIWPKASQMAAKEMMNKYGKPNLSTHHMPFYTEMVHEC